MEATGIQLHWKLFIYLGFQLFICPGNELTIDFKILALMILNYFLSTYLCITAMQPKDVITVMFYQDFREETLASSPLWLVRISHSKTPTPCTEKVLWNSFINKCLLKIAAECYCTAQYSGFVLWRKVNKIKLVDSSILPTPVLSSSFLFHLSHNLEQDKGLLGYHFLEKHILLTAGMILQYLKTSHLPQKCGNDSKLWFQSVLTGISRGSHSPLPPCCCSQYRATSMVCNEVC